MASGRNSGAGRPGCWTSRLGRPGWHSDPVWRPGETVVHQEVWAGRLWAARPLRVLDDSRERTLLWIPHGTRRKVPKTSPHRPDPPDIQGRTIESLQHGDWVIGDHTWDVSSLWILRPDEWHSTWVSWRPDGSHLGWYVNLQRPMRRNPIGFEAMDLMLDVVAEPDLSWSWKDREEFEEILPTAGSSLRRSAIGSWPRRWT